ncbi:MAG: TonB-dependent receptor [Thermodesulfovibrionales bacterium]
MKKTLVAVMAVAILAFLPCLQNKAYSVSEEEQKTFLLYFEEKDLVVSPTRSPKPLAKVAENITVITADAITLMNAHTLADVLAFVPGVQLEFIPSPGIPPPVHIQGSESRQVRVVIDGVTLNNLSDGIADLGSIPVQNIERIEIIKGPASSSWGSSSGGIINIVTKSPTNRPQELISASYGERNTNDVRMEASGTKNFLGYYLSLDRLHSNGFKENMSSELYNAYGKFNFALSDSTKLQITASHDKVRRGLGEFSESDLRFDNKVSNTIFTANFNSQIAENVELDISAHHKRTDFKILLYGLSDGSLIQESRYLDKVTGASAKIIISKASNPLIAGVDYSKGTLKSDSINGEEQSIEEIGIYSNYMLSFGKFTVTPGLRYDHTNTNGDFWSPSLGATYSMSDNTLLRVLVSRGFNIPPLAATFGTSLFFVPNPSLKMEEVWSYQAGIETRALRYIFLKGTVFRHDVSDAITVGELPDGTFTQINKNKIRRQGIEIEIRTDPFFHTSLMAGFSYNDITDRETGENFLGTAEYTFDFGIVYDTNDTKALLLGHYIEWNIDESFAQKNGRIVLDADIIRNIYRSSNVKADIFISLHNILVALSSGDLTKALHFIPSMRQTRYSNRPVEF